MSVWLPCGCCSNVIDLAADQWTIRRVHGQLRQVCEDCARRLDAQRTAQALADERTLLAAARGCAQVDRAVRSQQAAGSVTSPFTAPRRRAA